MNKEDSHSSVSNIQDIDKRNRVGEALKQSVRNSITSEGVEQGLTPDEADRRTKQLESWGELEKTEPIFTAGKNLQSKIHNN